MTRRASVLVTGGCGFIGRPLVRALLHNGRAVTLLVRRSSLDAARAFAASLAEDGLAPPALAVGDVTQPGLGLSIEDAERLAQGPLEIFHLAAAAGPRVSRDQGLETNVLGTAQVLDYAAAHGRVVHLHHVSSIVVAGTHEGTFGEDELERGQRLPDAYAASKYEAERLVRGAMGELAISVYRPGIVLGDSRSGAMDRPEAFRALIRLVRALSRVGRFVPVAAPAEGAYFHAAPVDYVAEALCAIAARAEPGKGYLLSDPAPLTWRELIAALCAEIGADAPRRGLSLRPVGRAADLPYVRAAVLALSERYGWPTRMVHYATRRLALADDNARRALEGTGIACPPLRSYLGRMVRAQALADRWEQVRAVP